MLPWQQEKADRALPVMVRVFAQEQRGDLFHHEILDIVWCNDVGMDCTDMFSSR